MFNSLHNLSHPGIRATQKLITSRFVWPGINSDVRHGTQVEVDDLRDDPPSSGDEATVEVSKKADPEETSAWTNHGSHLYHHSAKMCQDVD